jgi:serine/threonine protein kinase
MTIQNNQLPKGTVLSRYTISGTLSAGGFGIVYLAHDPQTKQTVVIKEYLPNRLAQREANLKVVAKDDSCKDKLYEGRQLFLLEVNALKKLNHPNIVHITDSFEAYGTVYIVMEYRPGQNLQDVISKLGGNLKEQLIRKIFPPLIDGVRQVHNNNLLHLDIKPGNILVQKDYSPILLDFGAVMRKNMSRTVQQRPVITAGFSPVEQYNPKGYCGPWTDIYAIGATMRACIEGKSPTVATERQELDKMKPAAIAFKRKYSTELLEALDWAMEVDPTLRPQTTDEFLQAFHHPDRSKPGGLMGRLKQSLRAGKST